MFSSLFNLDSDWVLFVLKDIGLKDIGLQQKVVEQLRISIWWLQVIVKKDLAETKRRAVQEGVVLRPLWYIEGDSVQKKWSSSSGTSSSPCFKWFKNSLAVPNPHQIMAVLLIFKDQTCLRKNILHGSHSLNQIIFEMIYWFINDM